MMTSWLTLTQTVKVAVNKTKISAKWQLVCENIFQLSFSGIDCIFACITSGQRISQRGQNALNQWLKIPHHIYDKPKN